MSGQFFQAVFFCSRQGAKEETITEDEVGSQIVIYLHLADKKPGYLLNFGEALIEARDYPHWQPAS